MSNIGLRAARELVGFSQSDLDRAAELPIGSTHALESGRVEAPSFERVVRIVRALQRAGLKGITGEQLFPVPDLPAAPPADTVAEVAR